jgi:hypothetical protein
MQLSGEFPVQVSQPSVPQGEKETAAAVKLGDRSQRGKITTSLNKAPFCGLFY